MWTYSQSTGKLTDADGAEVGVGYSGRGSGLNNPESQDVTDVGPIPQGEYLISKPYTDPEKGPLVMRLMAFQETDTHGRSGFLIHGDNPQMNHTASEGCIILNHDLRQTIASSGDTLLSVTA